MLKFDGLHPVGEHELEAAAEMLNEAFGDDASFREMLVYEKDDIEMTPLFYAILKSGLKEGGVIVKDSPEMKGLGMIVPMGIKKPLFSDVSFSAFWRVFKRYKLRTFFLMGKVNFYMQKMHAKLIDGPHYYLALLGVRPEFQGQGIGKKILKSIHKLADNEGKHFYLETQNMKNVSIYRKYGYELLKIDKKYSSKIGEFYFMLRQPQSNS